MCAKIENKYNDFLKSSGGWVHYKVDTDKIPRLKFYYDVRCEPFFQLLLNGANINRITGYNFEHLSKQMEFVKEAHNSKFSYYGNSKDQWVDYRDDLELTEKQVGSFFANSALVRPRQGLVQSRAGN
jgi:hypothetical protein